MNSPWAFPGEKGDMIIEFKESWKNATKRAADD